MSQNDVKCWMKMLKTRWMVMLMVVMVGIAACGSPPVQPYTPPPTLTPTSRFNTSIPPNERPTLPPTWTPTFTPSPTPVTPTPTATPPPPAAPLPDRAAVCAGFAVDFPYADGHTFAWTDTFGLIFSTDAAVMAEMRMSRGRVIQEDEESDVVRFPGGFQFPRARTPSQVYVLVTIVERSGAVRTGIGGELNGGQPFALQVAVNQLPAPGIYDWEVNVFSRLYGDLCSRGGWFRVREGT